MSFTYLVLHLDTILKRPTCQWWQESYQYPFQFRIKVQSCLVSLCMSHLNLKSTTHIQTSRSLSSPTCSFGACHVVAEGQQMQHWCDCCSWRWSCYKWIIGHYDSGTWRSFFCVSGTNLLLIYVPGPFDIEDDCLLGCCIMQSGDSLQMFRRCLPPPPSGWLIILMIGQHLWKTGKLLLDCVV